MPNDGEITFTGETLATKNTPLSLSTFMKQPITGLIVAGRSYRPQPDVTSVEMAAMLQMFLAASLPMAEWDFEEFIARHGLERHWPKAEEATA